MLEKRMAQGVDNQEEIVKESIRHAKEAVALDVKDGNSCSTDANKDGNTFSFAGPGVEESVVLWGNTFSFASSATSQLVLERIMSQSYLGVNKTLNPLFANSHTSYGTGGGSNTSGGKTVGRWLEDMKEKKREDNRAQNAQIHAVVLVAAALAAIAAATATTSASRKDEQMDFNMYT